MGYKAYDTVDAGGSPRTMSRGTIISGITKVILTSDDGAVYIAGSDTGRTFRAKVPDASQEVAETMLSRLRGRAYRPYEATRAAIDPAAELGDAVRIGQNETASSGPGVWQMMSQSMRYGGGYYSDISSPSYDETEAEYPYQTAAEKAATQSAAYTDRALNQALGEDGIALQVRIVTSLPPDHASQNVLWVISTGEAIREGFYGMDQAAPEVQYEAEHGS